MWSTFTSKFQKQYGIRLQETVLEPAQEDAHLQQRKDDEASEANSIGNYTGIAQGTCIGPRVPSLSTTGRPRARSRSRGRLAASRECMYQSEEARLNRELETYMLQPETKRMPRRPVPKPRPRPPPTFTRLRNTMWMDGGLAFGRICRTEFLRTQLFLVSGGLGWKRPAQRFRMNILLNVFTENKVRSNVEFLHKNLQKAMGGKFWRRFRKSNDNSSSRRTSIYKRVRSHPEFAGLQKSALGWVRAMEVRHQWFNGGATSMVHRFHRTNPVVVLAASCKSGKHRSVGLIRGVAEAQEERGVSVIQIDTASTFQPQ